MTPRVVSLTPAVFHLSEAVNHVSRTYGDAPIVPRGPRLRPLIERVRRDIKEALGAPEHEPVLLSGSGSTAMAAVLGSCLRPDERLLVIRNGAYGDRLLEFATTLRQPVVDMSLPYGERPDLAAVEEILAQGRADAVAVVYGGTSTCTLNPLPEIGALARKHGKKLLVDGVSALFVEPMDLDGWGVAAVMGSCNKGLHSHPNLTMALVRRDLLAEMEHLAPRAPSLELHKIWRAQVGGSHPYTIDPMSLCQVAAALDHLEAQGGVAGRHAIYQAALRPPPARLRAARAPPRPLGGHAAHGHRQRAPHPGEHHLRRHGGAPRQRAGGGARLRDLRGPGQALGPALPHLQHGRVPALGLRALPARPGARAVRPGAAGAALAIALAAGPARAQSLAYDAGRDLFISLTGAALWTVSEVDKVSFAPAACRWCSVDPLDASVRRALVWSPSQIGLANTLGNVVGFGVVPASAAALIVGAAARDGHLEQAPADVLVIAEAGVLAMDFDQVTKFAVGRQRPYVHFHTGTGDPNDYDLSFFSGHTTAAFSIAVASGTVATMRGYRLAPWVWAQGLAIAVVTGYLRIAADEHYFTDVLTGAVVGSAFGFGVPYLFHRPGANAPPVVVGASAARDGARVSVGAAW